MKKLFLLIFILTVNISQMISVVTVLQDTLSIEQLNELAYSKMQQSDRLSSCLALLERARKEHNTLYEGNALFLVIRHYYSINPDSMVYWSEQAFPLFMKEKRYEDLFRIKAWIIYNLTRSMNTKAVLDSVNELKELAKELEYPDGIDMANQALADYYISTGLREEGTGLYEEVLAGMEKRNVPLIKRVNVIRQLINRAATNQKCLEYLDRLKGYIELCKKQGLEKLDEENPISNLEYAMHRNYAMSYIKEKNFKKALTHLKKAEDIIEENEIANKESELDTIYATYYFQTGAYDKAIEIYDNLMKTFAERSMMSPYLSALFNKAAALMEMQRYKEAALHYQEYSQLNDSLSSASYYKNLAEMKTQHDVDKLQLEKKEMEVKALRSHNQMLLLGGGIIVLSLICCLLAYLAYTVHRFGKQLRAAKEKAEEADRLKSAFLANMNHEIRTPLNAIVGFSQILVDEEDAESRQQYFNIIQSNNDLLQRLIYDVLDLSKIESNTIALNYVDIELPALMNEIYQSTSLRMPEDVALELKSCVPLIYHTDKYRLTQIITNLLNNAIKHTEKGFIRFGYEVKDMNIYFMVEDSGEGIPEDKLGSIFSRFVQLNDWSKGVGLGLAICQGLIAKMGGTIEVTSKLGEGSVFTVVLPLKY